MVATVLMVAEKPSLATSIANILSDRKSQSRKGFNGACNVNEWSGKFMGLNVNYKMTSVCGHVMSLDFPSKYNNWDRVDPSELFACPTEQKEATPKLKMPAFLAAEAKNADYLVLWLDCDKEGENICFEVMNSVLHVMKQPRKNEQMVFRAKFSSITDKDIKLAMTNLGEPDENQSKSVDARQELDLRIGCAFTRYQTKFFQGKYGDLDSTLISYGPCQTPTLGFCVERHDQITTFKPEPYWVLNTTVEVPGNSETSRKLQLEWERGRCFDKEVAIMFMNQVKGQSHAKVLSVTTKGKEKERPIALNTVELMRMASSGLGMGPHHAMQIAEKLYTQGYMSYPRTESTQYGENFDLKDVLRQQQNSSDWGQDVKDLLSKGINKPRKGHDAGDHPPITPMRAATRNELDGDSWKIYDYVVRHFIGTVSYNCKYQSTTIKMDINGENFSYSGKKLTDLGFTKVMTWQAITDEETVPSVSKNDQLELTEVKLAERQTSPPDYLTEADLITLMEKHKIGTDASIPVHINNICQRNYCTVVAGRKLMPTTLGIVLVHGYLKIDPDLVHPHMRSAVEEQLDLIAHGKANFKSVLKHTLEVFKLKFQYFVKNIEGMDQLFEVSFSSLAESGRPFSRCGKCRRYMKYIIAKPTRLYCQNCDETMVLPQNGNIKLHQELKCPLDDYELLHCSAGAKGKSFIFCPYCYSNPPFPDMKKGAASCNTCTHPTCNHSQNSLGVSNCVECDSGILVLDPSSMPKWKLGCNSCEVIVMLFENAQKVSVIKEEACGECEAQLMKVEYKEGKSKLNDDKLEAQGCIFCDQELSQLVEKHQAVMMRRRAQPGGGRGGRGRGGRGRGGRGRGGRGRKAPKDKMSQLAAYFV